MHLCLNGVQRLGRRQRAQGSEGARRPSSRDQRPTAQGVSATLITMLAADITSRSTSAQASRDKDRFASKVGGAARQCRQSGGGKEECEQIGWGIPAHTRLTSALITIQHASQPAYGGQLPTQHT
jgi:hypothetical protein